MNIREELFTLQDLKYRDLQIRIIPTVQPESIIGVRTPELRKMARQLARSSEAGSFLSSLPHRFFEENQLHAFIISDIRDYSECLRLLNLFLPYVDNWATCDQMSPRVFRKHRPELPQEISNWLRSGTTYRIRFGIKMLMEHFLDQEFDLSFPETVAAIRSEEYYVNMMIAWYFATALAKQYDAVLPFIVNRCLDPWTHNKTIRKAIESFRISPEQKDFLRSLKISEAVQ